MPPIRAPEPTRTFFDPFNSSSTGHQRDASRLSGSTSWRDSRTHKLAHQLCDTSGRGGETHLSDLVGAGSEDFRKDGRKENGSWEVGAPGLKEKGWQDIRDLMRVDKREGQEMSESFDRDCKRRKADFGDGANDPRHANKSSLASRASPPILPHATGARADLLSELTPKAISTVPQIFRSLVLYLNGSTHASGISDHKLKSLFVQHGGSLSIALGRRTVTHVILGSGNAGGGLAAGKIQKEVAKVGGKGVKYVTAKWVVDSVGCGKRLSEGRYQAVHIAMKGQGSVLGKLGVTKQQESGDRMGAPMEDMKG